jgi:antitoxin ParD1/3/4
MHQRRYGMPRQSITLTEQNNSWLKNHVEHIQDYTNKSELINDLIRSARRAEAINRKLEDAERSGFVTQSASEMLAEFKSELR